jgi:hypothetical protein
MIGESAVTVSGAQIGYLLGMLIAEQMTTITI